MTWTLNPQDVQIWKVNLDLSPLEIATLAQTLSPDELQRAERFYFERDRDRFIAGRGTLRHILSHYIAQSPQQLQFSYSEKGKPALVHHSLQFNVSHSHELELIAVSLNPVGVDIEQIRPTQFLQLAQRFFHTHEYHYLTSLSPEKQLTTFFRFWTAKEAYLKGTGEGLAGFQQIELSLTPNTIDLVHPLSNWLLHPFIPAQNYLATIAVLAPEKNATIRYHLNKFTVCSDIESG
jgi:4'-phosphopantetheinyl transferase